MCKSRPHTRSIRAHHRNSSFGSLSFGRVPGSSKGMVNRPTNCAHRECTANVVYYSVGTWSGSVLHFELEVFEVKVVTDGWVLGGRLVEYNIEVEQLERTNAFVTGSIGTDWMEGLESVRWAGRLRPSNNRFWCANDCSASENSLSVRKIECSGHLIRIDWRGVW